jgi:photosystem I subunit VIII
MGGYTASYLSLVLIPLICWVFPAAVMGLLFIHIDSEV